MSVIVPVTWVLRMMIVLLAVVMELCIPDAQHTRHMEYLESVTILRCGMTRCHAHELAVFVAVLHVAFLNVDVLGDHRCKDQTNHFPGEHYLVRCLEFASVWAVHLKNLAAAIFLRHVALAKHGAADEAAK